MKALDNRFYVKSMQLEIGLLSGSQVYYKKSRMTIRAGIDKMDYHMFRRKYLLGCSGKLGRS